MKITATTHRLRVDYRLAGKVYNESAEAGVFDDGQRTFSITIAESTAELAQASV